MPKMEGVWVEGATDRIDTKGEWTLFIAHVDNKYGKGFMPHLKKTGTSVGFMNGELFFGTDEGTYTATIVAGKQLLTRLRS